MNLQQLKERELAIDGAVSTFISTLNELKFNYAEVVGILDIIRNNVHQAQKNQAQIDEIKRYMG